MKTGVAYQWDLVGQSNYFLFLDFLLLAFSPWGPEEVEATLFGTSNENLSPSFKAIIQGI